MLYGRGKVKALEAMLKLDHVDTLRQLGQEWEVSQEILDELQIISSFFYMATLFQEIYETQNQQLTKLARRISV